MEIAIRAEVDEDIREEVAQELAGLGDADAVRSAGIDVTSVSVTPVFEDLEDDSDFAAISEFLIEVAAGVLTAVTVKGLLALIKLSIEKGVNKVRRSRKTVLTLKTPDGEYNLIREDDRLKLKARIDKEVSADDREDLDRLFSEIGGLIGKRFETG